MSFLNGATYETAINLNPKKPAFPAKSTDVWRAWDTTTTPTQLHTTVSGVGVICAGDYKNASEICHFADYVIVSIEADLTITALAGTYPGTPTVVHSGPVSIVAVQTGNNHPLPRFNYFTPTDGHDRFATSVDTADTNALHLYKSERTGNLGKFHLITDSPFGNAHYNKKVYFKTFTSPRYDAGGIYRFQVSTPVTWTVRDSQGRSATRRFGNDETRALLFFLNGLYPYPLTYPLTDINYSTSFIHTIAIEKLKSKVYNNIPTTPIVTDSDFDGVNIHLSTFGLTDINAQSGYGSGASIINRTINNITLTNSRVTYSFYKN